MNSIMVLNEKAIMERSLERGSGMKFIEFVHFNNIPLNDIFVDQFFHNLHGDMFVYFDAKTVEYFGYTGSSWNQIKTIKNLVRENFSEEIRNSEDWIMLKEKDDYLEWRESLFLLERENYRSENPEAKSSELSKKELKKMYPLPLVKRGKQQQHLLIRPKLFKEMLMLANTTKGKQVRKYYLDMVDVMELYVRYQQTAVIQAQKCEIGDLTKLIQDMRDDAKSDRREILGELRDTKKTVNVINHKLDRAVQDRVVMKDVPLDKKNSVFIYRLKDAYDKEYDYYVFRCQNGNISDLVCQRENFLIKRRKKRWKQKSLKRSEIPKLVKVARIGYTGYMPNAIVFWDKFKDEQLSGGTIESYKNGKFDLIVDEKDFLELLKTEDQMRGQNLK